MIVDASAVVAVVRTESGWEDLDARLAAEPSVKMSAATYVELGIVVDSRGDARASRHLDRLLDAWGVEIVDVTLEQATIARAAYRDFGKGSGSRARLNFGDCFPYALASVTGEPLLFVGDDFGHTDVAVA